MNCLDETQGTIHFCNRTGRSVNYSVRIQEINVSFSTFKSFMSTVSIDYRQHWQAPDVPAELAKRVICTCISRGMFLKRFCGAEKTRIFLVIFG